MKSPFGSSRFLPSVFMAILCILWWADIGVARDRFVDSLAPAGGQGTQSRPWKDLSDIEGLAPGDVVHFAGTFLGQQLKIVTSGTADAPITFQQWEGRRPWVMDGEGKVENPVWISANHVTLKHFELLRSKSHGIVVIGGYTGIRLENISSHHNKKDGFHCVSYDSTAPLKNVTIKNCKSFDNGRAGFHHVNNVDGVTHWYNEAWRNGFLEPAHGFSSHSERTRIESGSQWSRIARNVYRLRLENGSRILRILDRTVKADLIKVEGKGNLPGRHEWVQDGADLYVNVGSDPSGHDIYYIAGECKNINYFYCIAHHNFSQPGGFIEGHGFCFDDFTYSSRCYGCRSYENAGHGFMDNSGTGNRIQYSLAYGNGGHGVCANSYTQGLQIENVASYGNMHHGLELYPPLSSIVIRNSIFSQNGGYGISTGSNDTSNISSEYNCLFANKRGNFNNLVRGATSIEEDPRFVDPVNHKFQLNHDSPCLDAGVAVGLSRDIEDNPVPVGNGIDIGPFENSQPTPPKNLEVKKSKKQID